MADTATTATPTKAGAEAFRKNGLVRGEKAPPASGIDLAAFDITDPEIWRQEGYWDYFARMRKEAPVSYTPDSPFGPYWNVTTYKDIMTVDTTHGVFSSEGGITVVDLSRLLPGPFCTMLLADLGPRSGAAALSGRRRRGASARARVDRPAWRRRRAASRREG